MKIFFLQFEKLFKLIVFSCLVIVCTFGGHAGSIICISQDGGMHHEDFSHLNEIFTDFSAYTNFTSKSAASEVDIVHGEHCSECVDTTTPQISSLNSVQRIKKQVSIAKISNYEEIRSYFSSFGNLHWTCTQATDCNNSVPLYLRNNIFRS